MAHFFTKSITQHAQIPLSSEVFTREAQLEHKASSAAAFQVVLPSQSLRLVVYLFAAEHKYCYWLGNLNPIAFCMK